MTAKHGGARPNSGRPVGPDGPTMVVAVSVPESLMAKLDELAEQKGWKRSVAVTEAIRQLVKTATKKR